MTEQFEYTHHRAPFFAGEFWLENFYSTSLTRCSLTPNSGILICGLALGCGQESQRELLIIPFQPSRQVRLAHHPHSEVGRGLRLRHRPLLQRIFWRCEIRLCLERVIPMRPARAAARRTGCASDLGSSRVTGSGIQCSCPEGIGNAPPFWRTPLLKSHQTVLAH